MVDVSKRGAVFVVTVNDVEVARATGRAEADEKAAAVQPLDGSVRRCADLLGTGAFDAHLQLLERAERKLGGRKGVFEAITARRG